MGYMARAGWKIAVQVRKVSGYHATKWLQAEHLKYTGIRPLQY